MKALVLGAEGQLGTDLVRLLGEGSGAGRREVSVTDMAAVDAAVAARRPEVVFNCAAYNEVDRAEAEPDAAQQVNARGAFNVAAACARHGARLVHFSTNFVFDGESQRPYVETDPPAPLGAYARSKLEGEHMVLAALPEALIVRTAAVFGGMRGQSFPEKILERATATGRLRVVSDQAVNPTYTKDLAEASIRLAGDGVGGIVHLVSGDCCAWDEFARAVLEELRVPAVVEPVSAAGFGAAARRPRNGCLASVRLAPLRSWREGLHEWAERRRAARA